MIEQIQWLGHGSFVIKGPPIIYINPWRVVRSAFHADVILVGHDHYEHFSPADINKLRGPQTVVISNEKVAQELTECRIIRPLQTMTFDNCAIKAIPAYSPEGLLHPREANGLGFVISMAFYDIYYAGDTKLIPEMDLIHPDIAILPIDGQDTLNVREAFEVIKKLQPRYTLPSNWGNSTIGASRQEAQELRQLAQGYSEVILPES